MSYTPDDQKLDRPISVAVEALDEVLSVIKNRQDDADRYVEPHIWELGELDGTISELRTTLCVLRGNTLWGGALGKRRGVLGLEGARP